MKGYWEIILVGIILAIGFIAGRMTAPRGAYSASNAQSSFDAEAKMYIDSKLTGVPGKSSSCVELPQLIDRVTQLEKDITATKKLKALKENVKGKSDSLSEARNKRHENTRAKMERLRGNEIARLKQAMNQACSGMKDDKTH